MKKKYLLIGLASFLLLTTTTSCNNKNNEELIASDETFNEDYKDIVELSKLSKENKENIMYSEMDFGEFDNVKNQALYYNNAIDNERREGSASETDDLKYIFYNNDHLRFVNRSDGYALNLKTNTTVNGDFSVAKYRSKIYNRDFTLTVSKENVKPEGYTWQTYRDEWLLRYINNPEY